jgi:hypothetical protein
MEYAGYVLGGWLATAAAIGGYAVWVLRRARGVVDRVPPERRRWSDS